jgi:hypothetical protein
MGADITQAFLDRAAAIALAAMALGRRLLTIMRREEAPWSIREQGPQPPKPDWSTLLDALRDIEPFFGLVSDPALQTVKEKLKPIGQRVNRCRLLPGYGPEHPLWGRGPEFNTEGSELWQAIQAVPRQEPFYAPWAEEDQPVGQAPTQGNDGTAAGSSPGSATPPIEPPTPTVQGEKVQAPPHKDDEEFLEFPVKQRKLLKALQHKGPVPMAALKQAVYGTIQFADSTLEQLITRTNKGLAGRNYRFEIKRKANTFCLSPL